MENLSLFHFDQNCGKTIQKKGTRLSKLIFLPHINILSKVFLVLMIFSMLPFIAYSQVNTNYHYVRGHYRSNGTYVQGYYRTNPNSTIRDNYSTYPNVNPHTGKVGTVRVNSTKSSSYTAPVISSGYILPRSTQPVYSTPRYTYPTSGSSVSPLPRHTKISLPSPTNSYPKSTLPSLYSLPGIK